MQLFNHETRKQKDPKTRGKNNLIVFSIKKETIYLTQILNVSKKVDGDQ